MEPTEHGHLDAIAVRRKKETQSERPTMVYVECYRCGNRSKLFQERDREVYVCSICSTTVNETYAPQQQALFISQRETSDPFRPRGGLPHRFPPLYQYVICNGPNIVARWSNNTGGWMLRRADGFSPVGRVPHEIPVHGEFVLIEIGAERRIEGVSLTHVRAFQLEPRWALVKLVKSHTAICSSIMRRTALTYEQKELVKRLVQERYLRSVWKDLDRLFK